MAGNTPITPDQTADEATMDHMHAKPKDRLWILAVIGAACALEVCATWTGIGSRSGFPVIHLLRVVRIPTDFCLMVCMEAYAFYALSVWLGRPGRRSGPFAMCSAIGAMALSLIGQVAYHVTGAGAVPPRWLIGFVSALPVVALFAGAILADLVRKDRADAEEAERKRAEAERQAAAEAAAADERTALRAQLADALAAVEPLRADLTTARSELARVTAKAETAARKLEAASGRKRARNSGQNKTASSGRNRARVSGGEADVDARVEAMKILEAEPGISGSELGRRLGRTPRYGCILKNELAELVSTQEGNDR